MFGHIYFTQSNISYIRSNMFSFKKGFKRKFAVVFCLIFIVSAVITTHAGAASGGGGGGSSRSSASGGGGGSSRSSASGGGGTGLDDVDFSTDDSDIGYEITGPNGHGSGSSVRVNRGGSITNNRGSSASGGGSGQDDMSSLLGYVPTVTANAYSSNSNMSGVMVTNGVNNKFVVTSKDGQQTSEYLRDWAVLTTSSGSQGWYHFDNNGNMSTGFINDSAGNTYYMIESGENKGMMAVGTVNINGTYYTFSNGSDGRTYGALVK